MAILIADGGATKTSWCLIDNGTNTYFDTEGYHPFYVDEQYIQSSLKKNIPISVLHLVDKVEEIWLYSAGGKYSDKTDEILIKGLSPLFPNARITIETDILAAARALLQHRSGMAAILGTGSNTCIYDGSKITENIESLGFLIGDEGSGAYMGKLLISDFVRGYMPLEIRDLFTETYKLTPEEILNELYAHPFPNRYCAKFAIFIKTHIERTYLSDLAYMNFDAFFKNIVSHYDGYNTYTFNAVGSIAYYFTEMIKTIAQNYNMQVSEISNSAIHGLVEYHARKLL